VLYAVTKLNSVDVHSLCSMIRFRKDRKSRHRHTTDDYNIRPHTVQEHNERTSTEFNLVTAYSTAHEPPEDCRKYGL
jgi:hypothetical protein